MIIIIYFFYYRDLLESLDLLVLLALLDLE